MDIITKSALPVSTNHFIKKCSLIKTYEVQRADFGRTIEVQLKGRIHNYNPCQFPYNKKGLEDAKSFAYDLYRKKALKDYKIYKEMFNTFQSKIIIFLVKYLFYKKHLKRTINRMEKKKYIANKKMGLSFNEFKNNKLIVKELPETLKLNKLMSIGENVYLLEFNRLFDNEKINVEELKINEIFVYPNRSLDKKNDPDFTINYLTNKNIFKLNETYKSYPERIINENGKQLLFFTKEDAEQEKEKLIYCLYNHLDRVKNSV